MPRWPSRWRAAGARVACAARSTAASPHRTPGTLDDTVARITDAGGTAIAVPTNLADASEVEAMVATTVAELGGLDVLVNNAAITFVGDLDIPMNKHDLVMKVNFDAPFIASRAAVPHMRAAGGGRILNVSSVAALLPVPGLMSYGVSKIALERLTVDLARQLQGDNIAVNCFRIDLAVASEGFVANTPGVDRSTWEPCEVAAEGILWMIDQPVSYSGRRETCSTCASAKGSWRRAPSHIVRTPTGRCSNCSTDSPPRATRCSSTAEVSTFVADAVRPR